MKKNTIIIKQKMENKDRLGSSFRDPSGFLYRHKGTLLRQVNLTYREDYERLMGSGLYDELVKTHLLIPHREVDVEPFDPERSYKTLLPEEVDFISYPFEWSFSQLKDAALVTLLIQKRAVEYGMSLKDGSAYNIQFHNGRAMMIDSLSFETYREGAPWDAYRQFCQHFLAPLSLMAHRDIRLNQLLRVYLDGIPLDLASRLLPWRTRINFALLSHIHLHAKAQERYAGQEVAREGRRGRVNRAAFLGLIDNLESGVRGLEWNPEGTAWGAYYEVDHNYSEAAFAQKKALVSAFLDQIQPKTVWDLGANTGVFSRLASDQGIPTVAFDIDPAAVERNYLDCRENQETRLLPLILDLTNPSPDLGWALQERDSILDRGPVDAVLALALIHHLAISNNLPLVDIAELLGQTGEWLVIEFVPKKDSQVQRLLAAREDIFPDYTVQGFERAFTPRFEIHRCDPIGDSHRQLYLMQRR
jgi:hypothetical protein